jgi:hypothetical protein
MTAQGGRFVLLGGAGRLEGGWVMAKQSGGSSVVRDLGTLVDLYLTVFWNVGKRLHTRWKSGPGMLVPGRLAPPPPVDAEPVDRERRGRK